MPTPKLEVAFGVDATAVPSAGQWVDLSDRLRSFGGTRGRERNLDEMQAGVYTFVLDNRDRALDPDNAAGPYYPNVLPLAHVRFTEADESKPVFYGFADGWPQAWGAKGKDATVSLTATDAFKVLANLGMARSVWEREMRALAPRAWWRLSDPVGSIQFLDSSASGYHGVASAVSPPRFGSDGVLPFESDGHSIEFSGYVGAAGQGVLYAPTAAGLTGNNYTIEAIVRCPSSDPVGFVAQQWDGDVANNYIAANVFGLVRLTLILSGVVYTVTSTLSVGDGLAHHVAWKRTYVAGVGSITVYIDGVLAGTTAANDAGTMTNPVFFQIGYSGNPAAPVAVQELVLWDSALADATIATHAGWALHPHAGVTIDEAVADALDDVAWPAGLRDIGVSDSPLQDHAFPNKALTYCQQLVATEEGLFFVAPDGKITFRGRDSLQVAPGNVSQITFGDDPDNPDEIPYVDLALDNDEDFIGNDAQVARAGGTTIIIGDATSQARYFKRTIDRTDLLHENDGEVISHGHWLVNRFKDPKTEVRSIAVMASDPRVPSEVFDLRFGDLVTVNRRPLDEKGDPIGDPISKTVRVEGVQHSAQKDPQSWKISFQFSPWDAAVEQPLVWDDATLGIWDEGTWGF